MLNDFKKFLIKGNAVDLAVGFIFGAAFATVVKSFVENVVMPPLGLLTAGIDFANLSYVLKPATEETEAVTVNYGIFINDIVAFIILGFAVFMIVRTISKFEKKEEAKPTPTQKDIELLTEIRDLMKKSK
ncbi:large-conductance mechanosensitive channel protein MscL [bacterium]|nr:large-conductance mechanosensitive channel protein MscL [bacterium]NCQ55110.1 large-conductance mechanosensitive channel protein MscL [Candidatus Parcubacteria bacterium]NCS68049.1 large-conductance mechanosensitive channel protein MscL [Candidatus Peregrinibacteria bacterium]NCS96100.1 large-conductance mechanosensitive channel protein MscL [bacterium]